MSWMEAMKRLLKNKKAGILDDALIVMIIFFAGMLILVFSFNIWLHFNDKIQSLPNSIADAQTKSDINDLSKVFLFLDKVQPFIFLVLWALVIMASMFVNPDHPFFFLVSLGVLFLYTVFFVILVDFGSAIFDNALLSRASSQLSNSSFFIHNFHMIGFFVMIASLVWFYVKGNLGYAGGGGNQGIQP